MLKKHSSFKANLMSFLIRDIMKGGGGGEGVRGALRGGEAGRSFPISPTG